MDFPPNRPALSGPGCQGHGSGGVCTLGGVETLVGFINPDCTRAPFSPVLCSVLRSKDAKSVKPRPPYHHKCRRQYPPARFYRHEAEFDVSTSPGRCGSALGRDAGLGVVGRRDVDTDVDKTVAGHLYGLAIANKRVPLTPDLPGPLSLRTTQLM